MFKRKKFTPLKTIGRQKKDMRSLTGFTGFVDENIEWLRLTPANRFKETTKLWQLYIALGGKLDPEPDPQSPFYFQETQG